MAHMHILKVLGDPLPYILPDMGKEIKTDPGLCIPGVHSTGNVNPNLSSVLSCADLRNALSVAENPDLRNALRPFCYKKTFVAPYWYHRAKLLSVALTS